MRILHTADWHLNEKLGQEPRNGDIEARLMEIARYLEEQEVDVMVVAGDLFTRTSKIEAARVAVGIIHKVFQPFLRSGGTIIAVSGNHDSEELFQLFREFSDLVFPVDSDVTQVKPNGHVYLYETPGILHLKDRRGREVQFVMMPYPTPSRYLTGEDMTIFKDRTSLNRALQSALARTLSDFRREYLDPKLPAVLVTHIHIRGVKAENQYAIDETKDVVFEVGDLPSGWAYIACGHIHLPQALEGFDNACYSGSVERMDFGEKNDIKSVCLVDLPETARDKTMITRLPLYATPMFSFVIHDPEKDIPEIASRYGNDKTALVEIEIHHTPGKGNLEDSVARIRELFPRVVSMNSIKTGGASLPDAGGSPSNPSDIPTSVREYLTRAFASSEDLVELQSLADALLLERGD